MESNLSQGDRSPLNQRLDARVRELGGIVRGKLLRCGSEHYQDLACRVHDPRHESVADLPAGVDLAPIDRRVQEIRDVKGARMRLSACTCGRCAAAATRSRRDVWKHPPAFPDAARVSRGANTTLLDPRGPSCRCP